MVKLADEKKNKRKVIYDKALTIAENEITTILRKQENGEEIEKADLDWLYKFIKMDNDTEIKLIEMNKAKKIEITENKPDYNGFFMLEKVVENKK